MLKSIRLSNFLSYGAKSQPVELGPLNVIIGPTGSGKSNLIDAVGLLQATTADLLRPMQEGGGVDHWLWKGSEGRPTATIDAVVAHPREQMPLRYVLSFSTVGQRFQMADERVENEKPFSEFYDEPYFYYRYQNGYPAVNVLNLEATQQQPRHQQQRHQPRHQQPQYQRSQHQSQQQHQSQHQSSQQQRYQSQSSQQDTIADAYTSGSSNAKRKIRKLKHEGIDQSASIISQFKDPDQCPELAYLDKTFSRIRLYREWSFGRHALQRLPQRADLPNSHLEPDGSNLGLVLNHLESDPNAKARLLEALQALHEGVDDFHVHIEGGTVQVFLREGQYSIPAIRLSDGTLRYLCLLAVLCHPNPGPLVCIEEPELGLHDAALPGLAELLIEASQRTQLIVTTHSDKLTDALFDRPEAILVAEKSPEGTQIERVDPEKHGALLDDYRAEDQPLAQDDAPPQAAQANQAAQPDQDPQPEDDDLPPQKEPEPPPKEEADGNKW